MTVCLRTVKNATCVQLNAAERMARSASACCYIWARNRRVLVIRLHYHRRTTRLPDCQQCLNLVKT